MHAYGGLAVVGSRGLEPTKTPNYLENITNIKSRQIITAGGKNEKVFEKSEWDHSAFTKNLLRALEDGLADSNDDGYITADELGDYLREKVSIDSENQQTPQFKRLTSHEGEFIFIKGNKFQIINSISSIIEKKSYKLVITKYDNQFKNLIVYPSVIAPNISSMLASEPYFLFASSMEENIYNKEFNMYSNLLERLNDFDQEAIMGDSLTIYWGDDSEYYLKVYVQ